MRELVFLCFSIACTATPDDEGTSFATAVDPSVATAPGDDDTSSEPAESSGDGETSGDPGESGPSEEVTSAADEGGDSSSEGASYDLDPPEGGSSGGSGGGPASGETRATPSGVTYRIVAPGSGGPHPLLIVYSGTEGGAQMTANLQNLASYTGTGAFVFAVLDGVDYYGNGQAGVDVLDHVRTQYDIDNDRTYLLSESAGTSAGLMLGLQLRQSYFAAFWANDVNAAAGPQLDAAALGFAPFGNAGPGGDYADANAIVSGMEAAGYRTPEPSPYDGPGAGTHGASEQFIAALEWFPGKTRQ